MVTSQSMHDSRRIRAARSLTEVFAPVVLIFVLLLVVGVHSASSLGRGLVLGGVAALFAGGLPYAILMLGIRRGQLNDRHLTMREQRPLMMGIGLISVTAGLGAMAWMGAPRALFALVAAMVTGVLVALLISLFWKVSIHTACTAGTVAVLVVVFGPALLVLSPLVAAIGWARVALGDHTVAQVVGGGTVGMLIAGGVMWALA